MANGNWQRHRISTRASASLRYQLTRSSSTLTPFFANRVNVSADAGIAGSSQAPDDWGPPSLSFPDVAGLNDANSSAQRRADAVHAGADYTSSSTAGTTSRSAAICSPRASCVSLSRPTRAALRHRRQRHGRRAPPIFFSAFPQRAPSGFGDPPAHLRGLSCDDVRHRRLAAQRADVESRRALGVRNVRSPTHRDGLDGAVHADGSGIEPRLGASWRSIQGASLVMRGSYGIYRNLGLYQPLAVLLIGQPPRYRRARLAWQNTPAIPVVAVARAISRWRPHREVSSRLGRRVSARAQSGRTGPSACSAICRPRFSYPWIVCYPRRGRRASDAGVTARLVSTRRRENPCSGVPVGLRVACVRRHVAPQRRAVHDPPPSPRRLERVGPVHVVEIERRCGDVQRHDADARVPGRRAGLA